MLIVTHMEIAGSLCALCGHAVVIAQEGKCCPTCGVVVHQACETGATCTRCGRVYEIQDRPIFDPARDAVVPRTLRRNRSRAPTAIVIFAGVLLLLFIFGMILLLLH
jgi:hypothetical protein